MGFSCVIAGTGSYIPAKKLSNYDLEKTVDTTDEWIKTRTGIETRYIAEDYETCSYMGAKSAEKALEMAGLSAFDLDMIIVATITPDMPMPSTACLVQKELGAKNAFAFDINAACSGFVYGLTLAYSFIQNNPDKNILLIGSEVLSKRVNWSDRSTCVLFGDGAGSVIIKGTENHDSGILHLCLHSDGNLWELLTIKGLGTAYPLTNENLKNGFQYIHMEGREVFKNAVRSLEAVSREALEKTGWVTEDVDFVFAHQANTRILEALAEKLSIPSDKVFININKYGNTSSASIPIAIDEANRLGLLKKGMRLLIVAFGGGFTWGAITMIW
jgi:3-oxoacyl-[acyl-carrier-protein] synthase-3